MTRRIALGIAALLAAGPALAQSLNWKQLPGAAHDIGIGPKGEAWVVGTNKTFPNDYGICRFDGTQWVAVGGGAVRIDVGPDGPWVVNAAGALFRWNNNGWAQVPGQVRDIGVGANGSVWAIGMNAQPGGYQVYRYNGGASWSGMPGAAVRIDVDPKGNAWVVNDAKAIYRWTGSAFQQVPGAALDIGVGADGSVWIVGTDAAPYQWNGSSWTKRDGALTAISVDHRGSPWGVNAKHEIFASNFAAAPLAPNDVTARLENLGIANEGRFGNRVYARNPWDMVAYQGKVYIGSGNSNNDGPDPNAGPVDVTFFDPATNKFGSEGTLEDEQIDLFRVTGSSLTIPGHDPTQNWTRGNFYRRAGEKWQQVRTVDWAIHMYDIVQRSEGQAQTLGSVDTRAFSSSFLFAALGTPTGGEIAVSGNGGASWSTHSVGRYPGVRARTFLSTTSALCVSVHRLHSIPAVSVGNAVPMTKTTWKVTSKGVEPIAIDLFPGVNVPFMFAAKSRTFKGSSYYFGAAAPIDHNWKSEAMFATGDCKSARRVGVPGKWFHHSVVENNALYVLTSDSEGPGRRNRVFVSADGGSFKEVLVFSHRGFAHSFAILNGDFYFGIGSEAEDPHPDSGRILRLRAADVPK